MAEGLDLIKILLLSVEANFPQSVEGSLHAKFDAPKGLVKFRQRIWEYLWFFSKNTEPKCV